MDSTSSPDREASPDWLRTFQTPLKDFKTLSSSSPSTSSHGTRAKQKSRLRLHDLNEEVNSTQPLERKPTIRATNVVDLNSDSEQSEEEEKVFSTRATSKKGALSLFKEKEENGHAERQLTGKMKEEAELRDHKDNHMNLKSPIKGSPKVEEEVVREEETAEGLERRPKRALSTLPLVFGDKVDRSKVLLECEGDAVDVSGDVGAVGRLSVSANHDDDFLLDLKGVIYKGTIVPSNTFFVVNIGQSEAKVEAIMNDFVQLQPSANIFETETMVEGTLEGFGFDSDDDRDFMPAVAGTVNAAKPGNECKDEKKQAKKKARSNKPLKVAKGSIKKVGKAKTMKATGKSGGTRKNVKKSNSQKRTGK